MHGLIGIDRRLGETVPIGPGQRHAEGQQAGHAEQQEQQVAELHHTPAPRYRLAEEVHGRPLDDVEPPPIEQVDDHRHRSRRRAGNGKPRI